MAVIPGCQNTTFISEVETTAGPYNKTSWIGFFDDKGTSKQNKLHEVIRQADFEFHLDHDDQLEAVRGPHKPTIRLPGFVGDTDAGQERFPGFVVVQLHKLAQIERLDERVARVNQFFFAEGANRVLVTGFRASGRAIYSDRIKKSYHSLRGPSSSMDGVGFFFKPDGSVHDPNFRHLGLLRDPIWKKLQPRETRRYEFYWQPGESDRGEGSIFLTLPDDFEPLKPFKIKVIQSNSSDGG